MGSLRFVSAFRTTDLVRPILIRDIKLLLQTMKVNATELYYFHEIIHVTNHIIYLNIPINIIRLEGIFKSFS